MMIGITTMEYPRIGSSNMNNSSMIVMSQVSLVLREIFYMLGVIKESVLNSNCCITLSLLIRLT